MSALEKRIQASRTALETSIPASDSYAERLKELADGLWASWYASRLVDTLEEAIGLCERLVDLRPPGHERRREAVSDLGSALWRLCFYHPASQARSDCCIKMYREAMQLSPPGHPLRDKSLQDLAVALLFISFDLSGDEDALAESVTLAREALTLRPSGHPARDVSLNTLASALKKGYEHRGDHELLEDAVEMHREALRLSPPGHPGRDIALSNLGATLTTSFDQQSAFDTVTEALDVLREALELRPVGHPRRFYSLANLAEALALRFLYQGFSDCLSEAIDLDHEVLQTMPPDHPQRAKLTINYAETLVIAFQEDGNPGLLSEAITVLRAALEVLPQGFYLRDSALGLLAGVLHASSDQSGDISALPEVKALHQEALQLRPPGHPRRITSLEGLADFYGKVQPPSWTEAYTLYCEALRICPQGYPTRAQLLSGIGRCFLDVGSPFFDPEQGITHFSEAYADNLTHITWRLRAASTDMRRVEATYTAVTRCLDEPAQTRYSARVLELYSEIISLLPRAANFGIDHKARLRAVAGTDKITRTAAARALLVGRISLAIETLEEGRGVFWAQTLQLRTSAFDRVPGDDREELQRLLLQLDRATHGTAKSDLSGAQRERELGIRRHLNEKAESLISKIRGYPGLDRFLLPSAFDAVFASLPDGFVVLVNTSELAHHALLLHRPTGLATSMVLNLPQTSFSSAHLKAQIPRDAVAPLEQVRDTSRAMRLEKIATDSMDTVLSLLWACIAWPIIRRLGLEKSAGLSRPRLWWCLTGELSFLPIHAAGRYHGTSAVCTGDYFVSSYIPTLHSLIKAKSTWTPIPRNELAGLLVWEESLEGSVRYLPAAAEEVRIVRECFKSVHAEVLNCESLQTGREDMLSLLQNKRAHVLHLACHAIQDAEPLNSAIMLHDGQLTIEDIMRLSLPQATLAYLSACQTAKGDQNAPDQAVHIAASMLFCGFRSIIGTLWLMSDEDGPRLARRFYEVLFEREQLELDDIPYALDAAVQTLRSAGVPARRWALFMHMGG